MLVALRDIGYLGAAIQKKRTADSGQLETTNPDNFRQDRRSGIEPFRHRVHTEKRLNTLYPPGSDVTPLMPNLFELLPFYVQIILLAVALLMLAVAVGFVIRVARSAFRVKDDSERS